MTISLKLSISDESHALIKQAAEHCMVTVETFIAEAAAAKAHAVMEMAQRTPRRRATHRSAKGSKLYAVRDKDGAFKDIQTYKRAHQSDVKREAKGEKA